MGRVWVDALSGDQMLFDTNSAERWDSSYSADEGDTLYRSVHGHWVVYLWRPESRGYAYHEIAEDDALDFFIRHGLEVPFELEPLSLFYDIDIRGLRHKPSVKSWPVGATDEETVICVTADGRWVVDNPSLGRERYRELSPAGAVRYFQQKGIRIPPNFIDDLPFLPDDLAEAVRLALPVPKRGKGTPGPNTLAIEGTAAAPEVNGSRRDPPADDTRREPSGSCHDSQGGYTGPCIDRTSASITFRDVTREEVSDQWIAVHEFLDRSPRGVDFLWGDVPQPPGACWGQQKSDKGFARKSIPRPSDRAKKGERVSAPPPILGGSSRGLVS